MEESNDLKTQYTERINKCVMISILFYCVHSASQELTV